MTTGQFYWCLVHKRVEEGDAEAHDHQLGPFATREAAENWKLTYAARNAASDAEDDDT